MQRADNPTETLTTRLADGVGIFSRLALSLEDQGASVHLEVLAFITTGVSELKHPST